MQPGRLGQVLFAWALAVFLMPWPLCGVLPLSAFARVPERRMTSKDKNIFFMSLMGFCFLILLRIRGFLEHSKKVNLSFV
jgi:hypothetical protein